MQQTQTIRETYTKTVEETKILLAKVQQQIYRISSIRILLFVAAIAGVIYFWDAGWMAIAACTVATMLPFLVLVKHHNRLFYKKEYLEKKIEINQQELRGMDYDVSAFDSGEEFIDPAHLYTYDLDVFGDRSLFQTINRTSTGLGKNQLAAWLSNHLQSKEEIEQRQSAVAELAPEFKFRQKFRILGLLHKGKAADKKEIIDWALSPSYYRSKRLLRLLPGLVLATNIVLAVLAVLNVVTFSVVGIVFTGFFLAGLGFSKGITKVQTLYGKKMQILGTYAKLIQLIEDKEVETPVLKEVKALLGSNKKAASQAVKRLSDLMNALDRRNNMLMLFVLNGLKFWELEQIMKIEAWKEECSSNLPQWLDAIERMDALCSLATFAYNNPDFVQPQIADKPFSLEAKQLGHPLMNRAKCVRNDVEMTKRPYFIIITGANMAGKSTYLRTIGINYLLACIGAPVFARQMSLYPATLITSLRTSDSLTDNESYFFAELKRLKLIIDKLNAGQELFIILDEILKGTNSIDKQKGSIALITQFMQLQANGIIATHDLLLGKLVDEFPHDISNYRFEADITNNELTFSYKLRPGVAQNMNACFLMKKMGIAVAE